MGKRSLDHSLLNCTQVLTGIIIIILIIIVILIPGLHQPDVGLIEQLFAEATL